VNEEMAFDLIEQAQAMKKFQMPWRDSVKVAFVGIQRGVPAVALPNIILPCRIECIQEHLFVIAFERNDLTLVRKLDHSLHYSGAVGTPVHVVPEEDQRILLVGCNPFDQRINRFEMTMNIPDCNDSIDSKPPSIRILKHISDPAFRAIIASTAIRIQFATDRGRSIGQEIYFQKCPIAPCKRIECRDFVFLDLPIPAF